MKYWLTSLLVLFSPVTSIAINIDKVPSLKKVRKLCFMGGGMMTLPDGFLPAILGILAAVVCSLPMLLTFVTANSATKTSWYTANKPKKVLKRGLKNKKLVRKLYRMMKKTLRQNRARITRLKHVAHAHAPHDGGRRLMDDPEIFLVWFFIAFFVFYIIGWVGWSSVSSLNKAAENASKSKSKSKKTRALMARIFKDPKSTSRKLFALRLLNYRKGDEFDLKKYPREILQKILAHPKFRDRKLRKKVQAALKLNPSIRSKQFLKPPQKITNPIDFVRDVTARLGARVLLAKRPNVKAVRKVFLHYSKRPKLFRKTMLSQGLAFIKKSLAPHHRGLVVI